MNSTLFVTKLNVVKTNQEELPQGTKRKLECLSDEKFTPDHGYGLRNKYGRFTPVYLGEINPEIKQFISGISNCDMMIKTYYKQTFVWLNKDKEISKIRTREDSKTQGLTDVTYFLRNCCAQASFFCENEQTMSPDKLVKQMLEITDELIKKLKRNDVYISIDQSTKDPNWNIYHAMMYFKTKSKNMSVYRNN
jgi:hypothetical protein